MKRAITVGIFIALSGVIFGQQIPLNNQYLINKYSLNPAYSGTNDRFEAFVNLRKNWIGIAGAPETAGVNVNGSILKNMGLGGHVESTQMGIFNTVSMSFSYAYYLKISTNQSLHFGLSLGMLENSIDATHEGTSNIDPVVVENMVLSGAAFDGSFGVMYKLKGLNVGFALPRLLETNIKDKDVKTSSIYTLKRHYIIHASYLYELNHNFKLEPFVVCRTTGNSPFFFEVSALAKYKNRAWLGVGYRKGNNIAISLGASYSNFSINYSYEVVGGDLGPQSSGTHEFTLGYFFNRKGKEASDSKLFNEDNSQPYQKYSK